MQPHLTNQEQHFPPEITLVSETDLQGTITRCNDSFEFVSGYSRDELIGAPHKLVRHPDIPSEVFRDMWATLQSGLPWSQIVKNRCKNGDHYWVRANVTPTFDKNGQPIGYLSVREAITDSEKQQAQQLYQRIASGTAKLKNGQEKPCKLKSLLDSISIKGFTVIFAILVGLLPLWITHSLMNTDSTTSLLFISAGILVFAYLLGVFIDAKYRKIILYLRQLSGGKPKLDLIANKSITGRIRAATQSAALAIGAYRSDLESANDLNQQLHLAVDQAWTNMMMLDSAGNIQYINQQLTDFFTEKSDAITQEIPDFDSTSVIDKPLSYLTQQNIDLSTDQTIEQDIQLGRLYLRVKCIPVFNRAKIRTGTVVEWFDKTQERLLMTEVEKIHVGVLEGSLNRRIDLTHTDKTTRPLAETLNQTLDAIIRSLDMSAQAAINMSMGNFHETVKEPSPGYFGVVKEAINVSMENISDILSSIKEVSDHIDNDSQKVNHASEQLTANSQNQAASIEQTSAAMEEITATVHNNSDNAARASKQASSATEKAQNGELIMAKAISSINEINNASEKIRDIINLIDTIAFQTNLLALNAAVEAARAGEHGRGFAVVAGEVRALAGKSADAAKEIRTLIEDTLDKVKQGTSYVDDSNKALNEIKLAIEETAEVVAEIKKSSAEQAIGISEINQAISNIDTGVQQNSVMAEETKNSANQLNTLSGSMNRNAQTFKIVEKQHKLAINSETNFTRIRMAHRLWRAKMRAHIYGFDVGVDPSAVTNPKGCELGKWIYAEGQQMFSQDPDFQSLEKVHAEMHHFLGEILKMIEVDDMELATQSLGKLEELSNSVIAQINKIEDKIAHFSHGNEAPMNTKLLTTQ